jgi:hypothetical protein
LNESHEKVNGGRGGARLAFGLTGALYAVMKIRGKRPGYATQVNLNQYSFLENRFGRDVVDNLR